MADVEFQDNSMQVITALDDACIAWLYEAAGELEAQVKRNTRVDFGQLKGSWNYKVDESKQEAVVGSPLENAIWEEFGTGEYAVKGNGRKGYWVYVKGGNIRSSSPKSYTLQQAKRIVAIMRKKGLDAYYTKGKKPSRALEKAFTSSKSRLQASLKDKLGGLNSG